MTTKTTNTKTFIVSIIRTSWGSKEIEVEATTMEEAEDMALEIAHNSVIDEDNAEYEIEDTQEVIEGAELWEH